MRLPDQQGREREHAGIERRHPADCGVTVGFTGAIEVLLALGAKIDAANRMGETPLIVAVQQRELDVVKMLLARGGNPDKKDTAAGFSARDYARRDSATAISSR